MWPELGQLPDWIFLRCAPFVSYPFCPRSSPSNDIINGLAGGLATSRERADCNHERIKYGCAGSPRQEVAFPSENGLREVFWIQRGWPTEHPPSPPPPLSLAISFSAFSPPSLDRSSYIWTLFRSWKCIRVSKIPSGLEKNNKKSLIYNSISLIVIVWNSLSFIFLFHQCA